MKFALKVDTSLVNNDEVANALNQKVDTMIELLGLRGCQNTIVGNEYMRGVSGGEKRRVTVGEILLGPAKAIFLDEPTSGLDSSTAEDIMRALRDWCNITRGSVCAALLQPTPEVFAMFDNIILLREGSCVYNGPRADVISYLESQGVYCPPDSDYADFITEYLSLPQVVYARQLRHNIQPPSVTDQFPPTPMASPVVGSGGGNGVTASITRAATPTLASATTVAEPSSASEEKRSHDMSSLSNETSASVTIHHDTPTVSQPQSPVPPPPVIHRPLAIGELPAPSLLPTNGYIAAAAIPAPALAPVPAPSSSASVPTPAKDTSNGMKKSDSNEDDLRGAMATAEVNGVPLTTAAMERAFRDSQRYAYHSDAVTLFKHARDHIDGVVLESPYARAQYGRQYAHSFMAHTKHCVQRQAKLMARQVDLIIPRWGQALLIGLILGSLFYNQGEEAFGLRVGLLLLACDYLSFGNAVEVPIMMDARRVAYKQAAYRLFPTGSYIFSVALMHLPFALIETIIFTPFLYFMTGFTLDAGRFFIFAAIMFCHNLAVSGWFRALALMSPNVEVAQILAIQSTSVFYLFGGFLLTQPQIPGWFIWVFWISPFSWTVRACSLNEFHAPRYSHPLSTTTPGSNVTTTTALSAGDTYLNAWDIEKSDDFIWSAGVYLLAFWIFFTCVSAIILHYRRYPLSIGTRRIDDNDSSSDALARDAALSGKKELGRGLRSDHATLAFNSIKFAVQVADKENAKKKIWRTLLRNVTGYAQPGTLTALMGASGAGKTTLLDVLAGRKTQGRIDGSILVNGYAKDARTFARVAGYVEQTDAHAGTSTVYETLLFAAKMRLPHDTPDHVRVSFVNEVLDILELSDIRNTLIGDNDEVSLSPGQLKRVTIGVELVANPSILFLDEPTTGLDSRGAQTVVRVIKRVAARGRAVVCTIHQPSAELFYMFDRLLLLQAGGYQVYFGPIGYRGREIVKYFEAIPGAPKRPARTNVASWMLEVIGAGTGAKKKVGVDHALQLSSIHVADTDVVAAATTRVHHDTTTSDVDEEKPIHAPTVYAHL